MASPKVIIITGASKGIGAALVLRLLSQSHKLVLTARSRDVLEEVKFARPDQVEFVAGDMTEPGVSLDIG
jgi:NADP-dependent 3-hydroxy acid dehydrogenase YdfG